MFGELPKLFGRNFATGFFLPMALFLCVSLYFINAVGLIPDIISFFQSNLLIGITLMGLLSWFFGTGLLVLNRDVIRLMEPECLAQGCHIEFEPAGDLPPVLADALQVQLVLVNLLQNAIHSVCNREGGDRTISIDLQSSGDAVAQVSVTDRGPGIPQQRIEAIFEPLYSGTGTGMGMGLAICRDIITAHGGRIWYDPNPAGGAIFRFTLRNAA